MKHDGRIAYETICAAKVGGTAAIKEILRHYERYILHFCRRTFYDEHGIPHEILDENRKKQIESEYINALPLLRYKSSFPRERL